MFIEKGAEFVRWTHKNKNLTQWGIIIIIILAAGGFYVFRTAQTKTEKARMAFNMAILSYNKGDIEGALTGFEDISRLYAKTKYGIEASYWLGNIDYLQGKHKEAREKYEIYIKKGKNEATIQSAYLGIADSYLQEGNNLEAAKKYEEIASKFPNSYLVPKALSQAAKCYNLQNNTIRADSIIAMLQKDFPDSPYSK